MEKPAHKEEFPPLLAQGFHSLSPAEVTELCVDSFPESTIRADIMAGLTIILERIELLEIQCEIWLDGSFTTQKLEPDDVDFIVFAPMSVLEVDTPELTNFIDWMNDNDDEPKKLFRCHTQIVFEGAASTYANDLILETRSHYEEIFGFSVSTHEPKGIVVLNLVVPDEVEAVETGEGSGK